MNEYRWNASLSAFIPDSVGDQLLFDRKTLEYHYGWAIFLIVYISAVGFRLKKQLNYTELVLFGIIGMIFLGCWGSGFPSHSSIQWPPVIAALLFSPDDTQPEKMRQLLQSNAETGPVKSEGKNYFIAKKPFMEYDYVRSNISWGNYIFYSPDTTPDKLNSRLEWRNLDNDFWLGSYSKRISINNQFLLMVYSLYLAVLLVLLYWIVVVSKAIYSKIATNDIDNFKI